MMPARRLPTLLLVATVMLAPVAADARRRGMAPPVHATVGDLWSDKAAKPIVADVGEIETDPQPPAELDPEMLAAKQTLIADGEKQLIAAVEADVKQAVALLQNEVPAWEQRCCTPPLRCDYEKGEVNSDTAEDGPRADACAEEFNTRFVPSGQLLREANDDPQGLVRKKIPALIASDPDFARIARGIDQIVRIEEERRRAMDLYRAKVAAARANASFHKCQKIKLSERKHCLDVMFDGVNPDLLDKERVLHIEYPDPSRYFFGGP